MTPQSRASRYRQLMEEAASYVTEEKPLVQSPTEIAQLLRPLTQSAERETFYVLHLDAKNHVLEIYPSITGLVDRVMLHPREVFRQAIMNNASRVIVAHNHPSGDPTPSAMDLASTRQLVEAGKIIGIEVLDHVILGEKTQTRSKDHISFREENLI